MANCPNSSAFEPSNLVTAFHSIPHVDIDLNPSPDSFELSVDYFQAVIIWACVPILVVICLFILMVVYFICICCCCCCQQHEKRSKASKGCCGFFVLLLVIMSLAMVGVGFWAEFELNRNILESYQAARNATDRLTELQNTTASFSYDRETTANDLRSLEMDIRDAGGTGSVAEAAAISLSVINNGLAVVFRDIQMNVEPLSFGDVDPLFITLDVFELARHWAVFGYLIFNAVILILVGLSLCFSTCCKSPICMVIMLVLFFFVTFVMWVAVGGNLALLVVSGDICFAPDALIRNISTTLPTPVSTETLDYYLICNDTCYSSPFQPLFDNATVTFNAISGNEATIQSFINSNTGLQPRFDLVRDHFNSADQFVMGIEGMASCTGLNDDYLSLLTSLCTDGYLYSLILFAMACGIAVFMVLTLVCGTFYAGLLSGGKEYDDETIVYDFPNQGGGGTSPWDSYGTQQHYTAYRESFDMRQSPQESNPPKYTDLQSGFNGNSQNGAVFADDGTVGVSIRPASGGGGPIDIGDSLDP